MYKLQYLEDQIVNNKPNLEYDILELHNTFLVKLNKKKVLIKNQISKYNLELERYSNQFEISTKGSNDINNFLNKLCILDSNNHARSLICLTSSTYSWIKLVII